MIDWTQLGFSQEEIKEAKEFAKLCYEGKRWKGIPLLIVMDACFDSIGLNYFTVVFQKTYTFYKEYVEKGIITNCREFLEKDGAPIVRKLINNARVVSCLKEICTIVSSSKDEFKFLREWAEKADPFNFKKDIIGRIKGVGINTFQYLRMQAGIDTIMPDKVIIRWLLRKGVDIKDPFDAIIKGHEYAKKIGLKDTELCWAIWIKESGELNKIIIM